jgi:uncharacterized protein (UPF0261 family)
MATVLIVGTMDTKGRESAYLASRIRAGGCDVLLMDVGILGEAEDIDCDITRRAVAQAADTTIDALRNAGSRGKAVDGIREGARRIARRLAGERCIHGAISLGGAEGAVLAASVMQQLPLGMPKIIVSPIASGQRTFGPFVGTSDISVMHSVVDILGLNSIACQVFDSAAAAVAGAAQHYERACVAAIAPRTRGQYAATMLGNTTRPLMQIRPPFEADCGDLVIFHANGVGGAALEESVEAGIIDGVLDFTLSEIIAHIAGGFHDAGPDRLEAAGRLGLPQLVVPGCIDFMVCGPLAKLPDQWRDRPLYYHNPEFTLVRASEPEQLEAARQIARKLNAARGPVVVRVPTRGLSVPNCEVDPGGGSGVFWNPSIDAAFRELLRSSLDPRIDYAEVDAHINDPSFADLVMAQAKDLFNPLQRRHRQ